MATLWERLGIRRKRQTDSAKVVGSSVSVVSGRQHGAARSPFNQHSGVSAFRSWIYAAASINANAVASTPIRLYVRRGETRARTRSVSRSRKAYLLGDDRGDIRPSMSVLRRAASYGDEMEEVVDTHPLLSLLASANPFLNGFDLTALRILYGELTGNAYLHPIVDPVTGFPTEVWPLGSQFVEVIPCEESFVKGYVYGVDAKHKQVFEPDEIIHFKRPNPGSLYYGLGKVEAAWGVVEANTAVHEMDLATFRNSARPDYAVTVKGTPTADQLDRFQRQVQERLRGTRKDGNFLTVTGDVTFTPLNFSPKDLTGRDEIVEEIAAVFGVPVSMLKANDPNLASATSGFAQWREGTVLPLCRMDEEELNQSLLPMFGLDDRYCVAYDNPVPRDRVQELAERSAAVAGGWRTPNEARAEEGREPIDDEYADRLLVGGNPIGGAAVAAGPAGFMGAEGPSLAPTASDGADGGGVEEVGKAEEEPSTAASEDATAPALNGGQVSAVISVLGGLAAGEIGRIAAVELLVAAGFDRKAAERMAEAQETTVVASSRTPADESSDLSAVLRDAGDGVLAPYAAVKTAQALGLTRKQAERAVEAVVSKVHRRPDEPYDACIERGVRTLIREGYDSEQATAIAHAMCSDRKALDDVDLKPTKQMSRLAERGLALREEHGRGGTATGVARARDIKNRERLSPETVGRMANFFSRHRGNLDAPAADPSHEDYPSAGVIAWMLWGGDPANPDGAGAGWAQRKMAELEAAREKSAGCGCCKGTSGPKVYEWPEETRMARLEIEGLDDDFARLRPKAAEDAGGDADDARREGEPTTPAQEIERAVVKALDAVYDEIEDALVSGRVEPKSATTKANDALAREILKDLAGPKRTLTEALLKAAESAARGGGKVGINRLNEILSGSGAGRVSVPALTDALIEQIVKRIDLVGESVIDGTVKAFAERVGADFSIDEEIKRVEESRAVSRGRAQVIARTESANAYHEGQIDAWKATGRVKTKRFLKAPGACPLCDAIDKRYGRGGERLPIEEPMVRAGETIVGTDGKSFVAGVDSQGIVHPNCRCDMRPVLD